MRQLSLFDAPPRPVEPRDPKVTAAERPRLSRQCAEVLDRLRQGPVSNLELGSCPGRYGLNSRARISDLRRAGFAIPAPTEDPATGAAVYVLTFDPERRP